MKATNLGWWYVQIDKKLLQEQTHEWEYIINDGDEYEGNNFEEPLDDEDKQKRDEYRRLKS